MKIVLRNSTMTFKQMNVRELKDSTYLFLSKYTKVLTKAKKACVEDMLDTLGYGEAGSIYSKLRLLFLPFLSGTVDECFYDPTGNTNIKDLLSSDISTFQLNSDTGKLINTATSNKNFNITTYLRGKGLIGPNVSEGFIGLEKGVDTIEWSGGNNILRLPFSPSSNVIACWNTQYYQVNGANLGVTKTGPMAGDCIGVSIGDGNAFEYGTTISKSTFTGKEEYINAACVDKEFLILSIGKSSGFKSIFIGEYLTETELSTLMDAIKLCITKLYT